MASKFIDLVSNHHDSYWYNSCHEMKALINVSPPTSKGSS